MDQRIKKMLSLAAFLGVLAPLTDARACSGTQTMVYQSAKTAWCVEKSIVAKYGAFPTKYFAFGDQVIDTLVTLFDVPAAGVYTFEASVETGGAHTGSECCGLGVTVTGDAFYGTGYGVSGFWGYLLALHETINDWTGQVSGGWPTDFWADHVSAFPNSMDWRIMSTLGASIGDPTLTATSAAQKQRFYPGGDSADPRVPMFDTIFALPTMGYPGWSRVFALVKGDQVAWDQVANGGLNPDLRRTEYVTAYVSLGAGQSVLPTLQAANVANGVSDGVAGDQPYTGTEAHIDAIATAHCAITAAGAQGHDVSADWASFRQGDYPAVTAQGKCGSGCPAECGCKASVGLCVAAWLRDGAVDGGAGSTSASSASGTGGSAGSTSASSTSGAGGSGGSDGAGGSGGSAGGSKGGGCSCRAPGSEGGETRESWIFAASALAALALLRTRTSARRR